MSLIDCTGEQADAAVNYRNPEGTEAMTFQTKVILPKEALDVCVCLRSVQS